MYGQTSSRHRETPAPSQTENENRMQVRLADDILQGAEAIAEFLFGDRRKRRRIYHLVETARLPVFRFGALVCARKTKLLDWIAVQESQGHQAE